MITYDGMQQARCQECGGNLGEWTKPHTPDCTVGREAARAMQGMSPVELMGLYGAGLQNMWPPALECPICSGQHRREQCQAGNIR